MRKPRKEIPGIVVTFAIAFCLCVLFLMSFLGFKFAGDIKNQNSNPHTVVATIEDKAIITDRDSSFPSFVIFADVADDDTTEPEAMMIIAKNEMPIYLSLKEGQTYKLNVNGDPDDFRVITGISP